MIAGSSQPFTLEWHVGRAFEMLGHSVFFMDYRRYIPMIGTYPMLRTLWESVSLIRSSFRSLASKANYELVKEVHKRRPEVVVVCKGEFIAPQTVTQISDEFGAYTIIWFPDDPRLFHSLSRYIAPSYDCILSSSQDCAERYKEMGLTNVHWLPFACDHLVHRCINLTHDEKAYYGADLCFVGTYLPERAKKLSGIADFDLAIWGSRWYRFLLPRELRRRVKRKSVFGHEMVKVYNASKIALNVHHRYDITSKANMRVFEVTGCGAFLLTDRPKGIESLYRVGKEIICYDDESEMRELANYYLDNLEERRTVAIRGQERAYGEHKYIDRAHMILSLVK